MSMIKNAAGIGALLLCLSSTALANPYELEIDVTSEEDLYDLLVAEQISDDTFQILVELLQRGVDLNKSSRKDLYALPNLTFEEVDGIIAFREAVGFISDPFDLVTNQILSEERLESIAAFVLVVEREGKSPVTGWARVMTRTTIGDDQAPPTLLQSKVRYGSKVTAGFAATLDNNRVRDVVFDPARGALSAPRPETRPRVPKGYIRYEDKGFDLVVGTFRTGFGQRLTFDKTDLITPDGHYGDEELFYSFSLTRRCKESAGELADSPCAGLERYQVETPDFRSRNAMLGASLAFRDISVGPGKADAHAFVSYAPQDIYQYELYDRGLCENPRDDGSNLCGSPPVFVGRDDSFSPTSTHSFQTLASMFAEVSAGGHLTYRHDYRTSLGLTGYGSSLQWLPQGIDLDLQEWSRRPFGGAFGAIGMDGAHGIGDTDLTFEVTRSFDSMIDGGGGWAGIVMAVTDLEDHEIQTSLRYYGEKFANPNARPISAPDEFEGLRAQDELGVRVRYTGNFGSRFNLRSSIDVWRSPSIKRNQAIVYLRGDLKLSRAFSAGLWTQAQDKRLQDSNRNNCFELGADEDSLGEPIPCAGEKFQVIPRIAFKPTKSVSLSLQYKHEIQDDQRYDEKYRQDSSLIGLVTLKPTSRLRLKLRSRYVFDDTSDNTYLEQSFWNYVEAAVRIRRGDTLRLRYDLVYYLDKRQSALERSPSPEHWLWLTYKAKF